MTKKGLTIKAGTEKLEIKLPDYGYVKIIMQDGKPVRTEVLDTNKVELQKNE